MSIYDIERNQKTWERLKRNNYELEKVNKVNRKYIERLLKDFELGINTPVKMKGVRKPASLIRLRSFIISLDILIKGKDLKKITEREIATFCMDVYKGKIVNLKGTRFKDMSGFIKNLKTFYRWMYKAKIIKKSIVEDLSQTSYNQSKPAWTYLTKDQIAKLIHNANPKYSTLILFLYDTGLRPEEAMRIKVNNLNLVDQKGGSTLLIPEEVSKTFAREIKLTMSRDAITSYIKINKLKESDLIIDVTNKSFNNMLKKLASKLFGATTMTKARGEIREITMYSIRHWSSIFYIDKYDKLSKLMYRMGWKKSDKINYYTEFLGMKDDIDIKDITIKEDKSMIQEELEKSNRERDELRKDLDVIKEVLGLSSEKIIEKARHELQQKELKKINEKIDENMNKITTDEKIIILNQKPPLKG